MDLLTLYHHGSAVCAAKVRFALAEKQVPWEGRYVDILKGQQYTREFLDINPKAVVPVLVHEGHVIPESTVICEYVEEAFPDIPIYLEPPFLRAKIRLWTKAVDEELHPACSALTFAISHRHAFLRDGVGTYSEFVNGNGSDQSAESQALKWSWIHEGIMAPGVVDKILLYDGYLHKMDHALEGSDWLVGNQFSMADIAVTPYVNRLAAMAMDGMWRNGRLSNLERWFDRIRARPAFKAALLDWMPQQLSHDMQTNGAKSWSEVKKVISSA